MRPLVVDTNIWVDWLRGDGKDVREQVRDRVLVMPATVAHELFSGARARKSYQWVQDLVASFERHRRLIAPGKEEFFLAGQTLADLGWPASSKSNDALIVACARRIGGEVLTKDRSDLAPLAQQMSVHLI